MLWTDDYLLAIEVLLVVYYYTVKGHQQYLLRFLAASSVIKDGENLCRLQSTGTVDLG